MLDPCSKVLQIFQLTDCSIRSVWRLVRRALDDVLARFSLKDLLVSESKMNTLSGADGSGILPASRPQA